MNRSKIHSWEQLDIECCRDCPSEWVQTPSAPLTSMGATPVWFNARHVKPLMDQHIMTTFWSRVF
jgi:hypothetical protein